MGSGGLDEARELRFRKSLLVFDNLIRLQSNMEIAERESEFQKSRDKNVPMISFGSIN